jgi:hypothetical protein
MIYNSIFENIMFSWFLKMLLFLLSKNGSCLITSLYYIQILSDHYTFHFFPQKGLLRICEFVFANINF